jgi:hypothetical protein
MKDIELSADMLYLLQCIQLWSVLKCPPSDTAHCHVLLHWSAAAAVAHTMGKDAEHHIAQLRHEGTRVVPVFVLALQNHPEDVVLSNR